MLNNEYLDDREKEIITFYSDYFTPNEEDKQFFDAYIKCLKKYPGLSDANQIIKDESKKLFEEGFEKLVEISQNKMNNNLTQVAESAIKEIITIIDLIGKSTKIEDIASFLSAGKIIVDKANDKEFESILIGKIKDLLDKTNDQINSALCDLIASFTKKLQTNFLLEIQDLLLQSIQNSFQKYENTMDIEESIESSEEKSRNIISIEKLQEMEINSKLQMHLKLLGSIFDNLNITVINEIDQGICDYIIKAIDSGNSNKDIGVLGCKICGRMLQLIPNSLFISNSDNFSSSITNALQSFHSEIRLNATKCVIYFIEKAASNGLIKNYVHALAPRICFNRRYVIGEISKTSVNAWNSLKMSLGMGDKGKEFLNQYAQEALEFYQTQLKEQNYQITETALAAFNEMFHVLAKKDIVIPMIPNIIKLMIPHTRDQKSAIKSGCFHCLRLMIEKWTNECKPFAIELFLAGFEQLYLNWKFEEVVESICTLLHAIYFTYTEEVSKLFPEKINDAFQKIKNPDFVNNFEYLDSKTHISFKNWEVTNGILILLKYLVPSKPAILDPFAKNLAEVSSIENYDSYKIVKGNLWKLLKDDFQNQTKQGLKNYIDPLLEEILKDCSRPQKDIALLAGDVLKAMITLIGVNIIKSKAENIYGPKYSKIIDDLAKSKP